MPAVRVLLAEDYDEFRRHLRYTLLKDSQYEIVAEVSDGLEAVRQAEELQPDLVLLDLSLPTLNGMEAGRQIRRHSPNSKIVFLSQESSREVMQGAFSIGALGYVLKSEAAELPVALETVMNGMQFMSSRLRR